MLTSVAYSGERQRLLPMAFPPTLRPPFGAAFLLRGRESCAIALHAIRHTEPFLSRLRIESRREQAADGFGARGLLPEGTALGQFQETALLSLSKIVPGSIYIGVGL